MSDPVAYFLTVQHYKSTFMNCHLMCKVYLVPYMDYYSMFEIANHLTLMIKRTKVIFLTVL